ncbi:hypothetical protein DPMN_093898 [Dreissena polymorpha]|uniref:Nucleoside diphosphate kinase-like domain-containing protein n=2 Tax=Dreissena polymorpha TaxID=45954 RepID=A0A9D4R2C5_DREPO|nr:hypothetical protein DPMN_093898 [Dreissena polymorpha]
MAKRTLQLTLAIFKPDIISHPHVVHNVKHMMLNDDFLFVRSKRMHLTRSRVQDFYKEHEGRFFYNRLVSFMSSGPISTHILARENAIVHWRKLMGPTKVFRTMHDEPGSIRGRYGLTDTRNCTHGSDSDQTAAREIEFFFPEFNIKDWYSQYESQFLQRDRLFFDEQHDVHQYCEGNSGQQTQHQQL